MVARLTLDTELDIDTPTWGAAYVGHYTFADIGADTSGRVRCDGTRSGFKHPPDADVTTRSLDLKRSDPERRQPLRPAHVGLVQPRLVYVFRLHCEALALQHRSKAAIP